MTYSAKPVAIFATVFAMTAIMASGANAANFTASSYPAAGSGGQTTKHVYTVQGQKLECTEATFTGSLAAASEQITIIPSYKNCTAFGFIGATTHMNGCGYLLTVHTSTLGSTHIVCPAGKQIELTAGNCVVHTPAQTPSTNIVHIKNEPDGKVLLAFTITTNATVTNKGFPCTLSGGASTGSYSGATLFASTEGKTFDVG